MKSLWMDDSGSIISLEMVLVATVVLIGGITGLSELRSAVVQELSDLAQTLDLDQSFAVGSAVSDTAFSAGQGHHFVDADKLVERPACLVVCGASLR